MLRFIVAVAVSAALGGLAPQSLTQQGQQQPAGPPGRPDLTAASGTGRIAGRVLRADTGAPLRDARVVLSGRLLRSALTDERGRYDFADLPAGQYSLQASYGGYLTVNLGQRHAFEPGRPFSLGDGEARDGLDVSLPRGAVIAGRITDDTGEPVTDAEIRIERYQFGPAGRELTTFASGAEQSVFDLRTNDRGEYRVFGLPPGDYLVSARLRLWGSDTVSAGQTNPTDVAEAFLPTYYPGTEHQRAAQAITVRVAQEVTASFSMVPGRRVSISGRAQDSGGRPAEGMRVYLEEVTSTSSARTDGGAVSADGSFRIGNVAPGSYLLTAQPASPGPGAELVTMPITVSNADLDGVQLTTRRGVRISGRLEWEGTSPRPPTPIRIVTTSARPRIGPLGDRTFTYLDTERGTVREDGTFELDGIIGPVLLRPLTLSAQWTVKSVSADDVDITDTGAEASEIADAFVRIVVTDRVTEVAGSVRDEWGERVTDCVVVLLPEEPWEGTRATRYTRTIRPDEDGVFRTRALPPGRYVAAAVDSLEQGAEWDPAVQKAVRASGRAFTLAEGENLTLSVEKLR